MILVCWMEEHVIHLLSATLKPRNCHLRPKPEDVESSSPFWSLCFIIFQFFRLCWVEKEPWKAENGPLNMYTSLLYLGVIVLAYDDSLLSSLSF